MTVAAHRSRVARRRFQRAVILALASSGAVCELAQADRYWALTSGGSWNTAANWASTSGGGGGAGVPGASDDAFVISTDAFFKTITYNGSYNSNLFVEVDNDGGGTNAVSQTGAFDLTCRWLLIGERAGGDGQWSQSNGTNTLKTYLVIADLSTATGRYNLSGGTINLNGTGGGQLGMFVGYGGTGSFTQTGGTVTAASNVPLVIGLSGTASGTYTLSGASASASFLGSAYVGGSDTASGHDGNLNISAGTMAITNVLKVWNSTGTIVNLSGGLLKAGSIDTNGNTARFNWTGGDLLLGFDSSSSTFSSAGSGSGSLTKAGTGVLTISAAQTYTGATSINVGTLRYGVNNAVPTNSAVTVQSVATLDMNGFSGTIGSLAGDGAVTLSGALTLGGNNSSTTHSGVISGSGSLTKVGTGTFTLSQNNSYTGGTNINGGTLVAIPSFIGSGALTFDGGTLAPPGHVTFSNNITLNAGGGTFIPGGNFTTLTGIISGSGALTASGLGLLKLSNSSNSYAGATTVGASTTLTALAANVVPATSNVSLASGAVFDLNGFSQTIGALTGSGNVTLGGASLTTGGSNPATTYTGIIGGSGSLTKTGSGMLTFSASQTYTGPTTVNGGQIRLAGSNLLPDSSAVSVTSPGSLNLNGFSDTVGSLAGDGNVSLGAGTLTVGGNNTSTTHTGTISGASGTFVKNGTGTLTLGGINSHAGGTTINAGVVAISSTDNLGLGTTTINGGTLRTLASVTHPLITSLGSSGGTVDTNGFSSVFTNLVGGSGSLTKNGAGTLTLEIGGNYAGGTTINAGTLQIGNGGSAFGFAGNVVNNATLAFNHTDSFAQPGVVSGSGALTKSGIGTLVLSAANTYTGATTITAGTLQNDIANAVPAGSSVSISSGATYNLNNFNNTIGGLSGAGSVTLGSGNLTVNRNGAFTTYSGVMSGSGALVVNTGGILTLTGANTYSGGTTSNSGVLDVANTSGSATGTGPVAINGGSLTGGGSISGAVGINSSAHVYPGGSGVIGTLSTGALTLSSGSYLHYELNNNTTVGGVSNDLLSVTGNLTLGASANFILNAVSGDVTNGSYRLINYTGSLTGDASGWSIVTNNASGPHAYTFSTSTAGQVNLIVVDSSSTWTGATSANWDTGSNWSTANEPLTANDLFFPTPVPGTGSTITLTSGEVAKSMTFNASYTLTGGTLELSGGTVTVASSRTATISASLTGTSPLIKNSPGTLQLTASNSYGGGTTINDGVLHVTHGGALGSAFAVTTQTSSSVGGELHLSNNISVPNSLTIGGAGNLPSLTSPGTTGALHSASGANTWSGTITLNGAGDNSTFDMPQISAETGATLVLSGVIQNGAGDSLAKSRLGDVVLTGASPNTYTDLTRAYFGRLIIEKDAALGAAGSSTVAAGNTFQLNPALPGTGSTIAFRAPASSPAGFNYSTFELINTGGSGLTGGQIDNLGGANTFAGNLGLSGPTSGGFIQSSIGVTAGSLELAGGIYTNSDAGGSRQITKLGAGTLIISGDSSLPETNTFSGPLSNSILDINAGTVEMRGNLPGVITWNVNNGGALNVTGGVFAPTTVNVAAGGQLTFTGGSPHIANLIVDPAGSASIAPGADIVQRIDNVTANDTFDISDDKLIITTTTIGTHNGSNYTGVTGMVATGRGDGTWNGATGITTSMSDATGGSGYTSLAVASASEARGISASATDTWAGQTVTGSDTLVMYTYGGDANLSGNVDVDDYGQIDFNASTGGSLTGWFNGDFDYNGVQDVDDYGMIDFVVGIQGAPFPTGAGAGMTVSSVPEPTAIGLTVLSGAMALRRRRRR